MTKYLKEELADYCHDAWSRWMRYMVSKGRLTTERQEFDRTYWTQMEVPSALISRWNRQMKMPYNELPESEKGTDRDEAEKILSIVLKYLELHHGDLIHGDSMRRLLKTAYDRIGNEACIREIPEYLHEWMSEVKPLIQKDQNED